MGGSACAPVAAAENAAIMARFDGVESRLRNGAMSTLAAPGRAPHHCACRHHPGPRMRCLLLLLPLAACATPPQEVPAPGMPNPAAVYCMKQGGTVIDRQTAIGAEGWCHLPSGLVVEEWAFLHQMNP